MTTFISPHSSDVTKEERQHEKRTEHYVPLSASDQQNQEIRLPSDLTETSDSEKVRQTTIDKPMKIIVDQPVEFKEKSDEEEVFGFWHWVFKGWKKSSFAKVFKAIALPLVIGVLPFILNGQQTERARKMASEQYQQEALQSYLDQMSELIIDRDLHLLQLKESPSQSLDLQVNDEQIVININEENPSDIQNQQNKQTGKEREKNGNEAVNNVNAEEENAKKELQEELVKIAKARTLTTLLLKELAPWRRDLIIDFLRQDEMIQWIVLEQGEYVLNEKKTFEKTAFLFAKLRLFNVDLSNANLKEVDLTKTLFENANLENANLSKALIDGTQFQASNLRRAVFDGVNSGKTGKTGDKVLKEKMKQKENKNTLYPSFFQYSDLEGASFRSAYLPNAIFNLTHLKDADFSGLGQITKESGNGHIKIPKTDLSGSQFQGANLEGAKFQNAILKGANFGEIETSLEQLPDDFFRPNDLPFKEVQLPYDIGRLWKYQGRVWLSKLQKGQCNKDSSGSTKLCTIKTNLRGANFEGADLKGANFEGADLTRANLQGTGVTKEQLLKHNAKLCRTKITGQDGKLDVLNKDCWWKGSSQN